MRILFYFLDAARYRDFERHKLFTEQLSEFDKWNKYFTAFHTTYKQTLSTLYKTNYIEFPNCNWLSWHMSERMWLGNNLLKLDANKLGLTVRVKILFDVNNSEGNNKDYYTDFIKTAGDECVDTLDQSDNVLDFIYDCNFHDKFCTMENNIDNFDELSEYAFNLSKDYFNKEFFNSYDKVMVFSDHGYVDWDGEKNPNPHGMDGSPEDHCHAILYTRGIRFEDVLICNTDFVDLLLHDVLPYRSYVVTHCYNYDSLSPCTYFNLTDRNGVTKRFDMLGWTCFEGMPKNMTKVEFDWLWASSKYFRDVIKHYKS